MKVPNLTSVDKACEKTKQRGREIDTSIKLKEEKACEKTNKETGK
jgi:hypothetical protein